MSTATVTASPSTVYLGGSVSITVRNGYGITGSYTLSYGYGRIASGNDYVDSKTFSWSVPTSASNKLVSSVLTYGAASTTISWNQYDSYSSTSMSGSTTVTVRRADVPAFSLDAGKYSIGDTVTFTINGSSSLYTHTITYTCGSQTGTVASFSGSGSKQTRTWTVPTGLELGNVITFTMTTKYSSTTLGSSTQNAQIASPMWVSDSEPDVGDTIQIRTSLEGKWDFSWTYGEETQSIAEGVTETSYDWTIPPAVAMAFPALTNASVTLTGECTPSNSETAETYTVTMKVTVPNVTATQPVVSAVLTPRGEGLDINPDIYYQNIRGVKATVTAASEYSTISRYAMTVESVETIGSGTKPNVLESAAFQQSGDVPVTITVTDARGYRTVLSETVPVVEYFRPAIIPYTGNVRATAERSGDEQTDLYVLFGATCMVVDGSEGAVSLRIGTGEWVSVAGTTSGAWEGSKTIVNALPDITAIYKVYLRVTDGLGMANVFLIEVPSTGTPLHLAEGGRRIGFGGFVNNATADRTHHFWKSVFHVGADVSDSLCGTLDGGAGAWQWTLTRDAIDSFNLFLCEILSADTVTGCFLACRSDNVLEGQYGTETLRMEKATTWGLDSCEITSGSSIRIIALL